MTTAQAELTPATMADNLIRLVMTSSNDFPAEFIVEVQRFIHEVYLFEEDLNEEIQLRWRF